MFKVRTTMHLLVVPLAPMNNMSYFIRIHKHSIRQAWDAHQLKASNRGMSIEPHIAKNQFHNP